MPGPTFKRFVKAWHREQAAWRRLRKAVECDGAGEPVAMWEGRLEEWMQQGEWGKIYEAVRNFHRRQRLDDMIMEQERRRRVARWGGSGLERQLDLAVLKRAERKGRKEEDVEHAVKGAYMKGSSKGKGESSGSGGGKGGSGGRGSGDGGAVVVDNN